jgi:hypothetical protein
MSKGFYRALAPPWWLCRLVGTLPLKSGPKGFRVCPRTLYWSWVLLLSSLTVLVTSPWASFIVILKGSPKLLVINLIFIQYLVVFGGEIILYDD